MIYIINLGKTIALLAVVIIAVIAVGVYLGFSSIIQEKTFSVDCTGIVTEVVDGDTIDVRSESGFMAGETFRVRFADVDTPKSDTSDGSDATSALSRLIERKRIILDIDDIHTYDTGGTRVVAVIYLQIDESNYLNINKWLVDNGYARIWDHDNEFDPYSW